MLMANNNVVAGKWPRPPMAMLLRARPVATPAQRSHRTGATPSSFTARAVPHFRQLGIDNRITRKSKSGIWRDYCCAGIISIRNVLWLLHRVASGGGFIFCLPGSGSPPTNRARQYFLDRVRLTGERWFLLRVGHLSP